MPGGSQIFYKYGFDKVRLTNKVFKTRNRCRMIQYVAPRACALPGCGLPVTALHARGGCQSEQQSGLITDAANALVHCVGKYVAKGHYGRWKLLINAGVKFGTKQHDDTCPNWMLPPQGSPLPGARRDYSDKPDMMLIIGLEPGAPVPTVSTPGIGGMGAQLRSRPLWPGCPPSGKTHDVPPATVAASRLWLEGGCGRQGQA